MKVFSLILIFFLCGATLCFAQDEALLIDDFENPLSGGPDGTVDFGAGGGSAIEVTADTNIKYSGEQSLKITYDAVSGGYMWAARGLDLDAKNATWQVSPQDIDWTKFKAIAFYMYGSDSQAKIVFDIKDNGSQMWRFMLEDSFKGWKKVVCPFNEFFPRSDWQPNNADKNSNLDFPIKSFQFEPLPEAKGIVWFDAVELEP